ncbi:ribosome biogenesis protein [Candidatus Woesearchaeota archaeon]|nr:ribosome biogenesis protein [Candidatus Woesearchaeota archaeon]
MKHIRKCICLTYTMKEQCPKCKKQTKIARPPKYSPEDKYAKYRRMYHELEDKAAEEHKT